MNLFLLVQNASGRQGPPQAGQAEKTETQKGKILLTNAREYAMIHTVS